MFFSSNKSIKFNAFSILLPSVCAILLLTACSPEPDEVPSGEEELIVYSSRNEQLIKPIFDQYTAETGVAIRFISDDAAPLIQRLIAEGANTPADLLLTVDAGNLWYAKNQDLLQAIDSPLLTDAIPEHLRDPDGHWFGLSVRARTLVYHPERVTEDELVGYKDLADEKWRDRLCLRTSKKVYNQSLVAMLIATYGEEDTEKTVRGWIANLAAPVFSSDTKLIQAMAAGQCDVGIVNSYYLGRLVKADPDYPVELFWADQDGDGVHVNISGIGITRHSKKKEQATRFVEWLAAKPAQQQFASVNIEFPANTQASVDSLVAKWGTFRPQLINVSRAGELQSTAVRLMDRAGYQSDW